MSIIRGDDIANILFFSIFPKFNEKQRPKRAHCGLSLIYPSQKEWSQQPVRLKRRKDGNNMGDHALPVMDNFAKILVFR